MLSFGVYFTTQRHLLAYLALVPCEHTLCGFPARLIRSLDDMTLSSSLLFGSLTTDFLVLLMSTKFFGMSSSE